MIKLKLIVRLLTILLIMSIMFPVILSLNFEDRKETSTEFIEISNGNYKTPYSEEYLGDFWANNDFISDKMLYSGTGNATLFDVDSHVNVLKIGLDFGTDPKIRVNITSETVFGCWIGISGNKGNFAYFALKKGAAWGHTLYLDSSVLRVGSTIVPPQTILSHSSNRLYYCIFELLEDKTNFYFNNEIFYEFNREADITVLEFAIAYANTYLLLDSIYIGNSINEAKLGFYSETELIEQETTVFKRQEFTEYRVIIIIAFLMSIISIFTKKYDRNEK